MSWAAYRQLLDDDVERHVLDDATLNGQPIQGAFSAPWQEPVIGARRTPFREPVFTIRDNTVAPIAAVLVIHGTTYEIVRSEPDGTGWIDLLLRPKR